MRAGALRVLAVCACAFALFAGACRQDSPQEPKTPPNSPFPEIDKPTDPKPGPSPLSDGGASSSATRPNAHARP